MIKRNSLAQAHLLMALVTTLVCETIHSQSLITNSAADDSSVYLKQKHFGHQQATGNSTRIKWTWLLPTAVKQAFNKSHYANWFVEKIISCHSNAKTIYKFYINNGSLLDGDHYDSFLKQNCLDISDDGMVLHDQSLYKPN